MIGQDGRMSFQSKTMGRSNSQIAAQVMTGLQRPPSPRPSASLTFQETFNPSSPPQTTTATLISSTVPPAASPSPQSPPILTDDDSFEIASSPLGSGSGRLSSASLNNAGSSTPTTPKAKSWASRAKHWGASKAAQSKSLTKALSAQFLGVEGDRAYNAVISAVNGFYGESEAQTFEKHIVSILLKMKVLFDDGLISIDHIQAFQEVLQQLMTQMQSDLASTCEEEKKANCTVNVAKLVALFQDLESLCLDFLQELLTKKTLDKIRSVMLLISDSEFLKDFFNNDENTAARVEANDILSKLLRMRSSSKDFKCKFPECSLSPIQSDGAFQSSGFCTAHHIEHFARVVSRPEIHFFLSDNQSASLHYREYLAKLTAASSSADSAATYVTCFDMICAVNRWKSVQSKEVKIRNARSIAKAFICDRQWTVIQLPAPIQEQVDSLFNEDRTTRISSDFFDELLETCIYQLEKSTFSRFLSSEEFKKFLKSTALPAEENKLLTGTLRRRKSTQTTTPKQ
jgi:hypothetical protein